MLSLIPVVGPMLAIIVTLFGPETVLEFLGVPLHIAFPTVMLLEAPLTALFYGIAF